MFNIPRFAHARQLIALVALVSLAACGCGNCNAPAYNSTVPTPGPGATPAPLPTPIPPGGVSCSQGGPDTIPLGAALSPFALLAGTTITNTGNTVVSGTVGNDLVGVWPGSSVVGFPPGVLSGGVGDIYAGSAKPMSAQGDLTIAYGAAAAAAPNVTFLGGTDLSAASSGISNCGPLGTAACGVGTLGAGVYKSPTSLFITAGNLTLDGGGNAQSVFIFQMVSALNTGAVGGEGNVILINGASPCNIYWQVGSSAVIGATGGAPLTFYGNILAHTSVSIYATTFTGRALASTAAVTIPVSGGSNITSPGGD